MTERLHVTRSRAKPGGAAQSDEGVVPFRSRKPPWLKVKAPGGPSYRRIQGLMRTKSLHTVCEEANCPNIGECWERGTAQPEDVVPFRSRKPPWLKVKAPGGPSYRRIERLMRAKSLHTVCEEANCPNIGECWERGTATFMILGDVCTRRCGFCNVQTGVPGLVDRAEPLRVAHAVKQMELRHCVVTSVDRDDLPDGGAGVFADTIRAIRARAPRCAVEVLTPDFRGQEMPLARVIDARPDVFNHNVETVPRLYPKARRGSDFLRSCRVLRNAGEMDPQVVTKSGLMVGLGESMEEMVEAFGLLREHGVQVLTVGQYLRPSENHLPVVRYWEPGEFAALEREAYAMGFESVASGPLVRSSYHADEQVPVRRAARA